MVFPLGFLLREAQLHSTHFTGILLGSRSPVLWGSYSWNVMSLPVSCSISTALVTWGPLLVPSSHLVEYLERFGDWTCTSHGKNLVDGTIPLLSGN